MRVPAFLSRLRSTSPEMLRKQAVYAKWLLFSVERHSISYQPSRGAEMAVAAALAIAANTPLHEMDELVARVAADRTLLDALYVEMRGRGQPPAHDLAAGIGKHLFYASALRQLEPRAICEIGTYLGFGARVLADAAQPYGGHVTTIDHRRYEPNFLEGAVVDRIERDMLAADAGDWLASQGFDFVIWDAIRNRAAESAVFDPLMHARVPYLCANWHSSGALFEAAARHGYRYIPVSIDAAGHWYGGTQLGFAFL